MNLIDAIIEVESGGNDNVIGDKTLTYSAYGCLQIRWPLVLDVNRHYGESHRARECLGNRELSIDLFHKYIAIYATPKLLGHEPTPEDIARLWNGGPGAMLNRPVKNPRVEAMLQAYWRKVEHLLNQKPS